MTPSKRQAQDRVHVVDREHLAFAHECGPQAVDDELRPKAVAEQADDAIDVAHRRNLGRADDDRLVGAGDRVAKAELDARRDSRSARSRSARAELRSAPSSSRCRPRPFSRDCAAASRRACRRACRNQRVVERDALFEHVEQMVFDAAFQAQERCRGCAGRRRRRPARPLRRGSQAPSRDSPSSSSYRRRLCPRSRRSRDRDAEPAAQPRSRVPRLVSGARATPLSRRRGDGRRDSFRRSW